VALVSFAGAVVVGLACGHSAAVILGRAIVVMLLSWVAGRLLGALAQHCVEQTIRQYKEANPIPEVYVPAGEAGDEEVVDAIPISEMDQFVDDRDSRGAMPGSRMAREGASAR